MRQRNTAGTTTDIFDGITEQTQMIKSKKSADYEEVSREHLHFTS